LKEHLFNTVDIVVVPLVLLMLVTIALLIKKKQPVLSQKYFLKAFALRILGTFAISAITEFYYKYGDTYHYYNNAQMLKSYFLKDPSGWLKLLFSSTNETSENAERYLSLIGNYDTYSQSIFKNIDNATVCKIASVLNLVCFDSYLGIALIFGFLSFLGCWYIFKTFIHIFPGYENNFAWICLFLPSLWFWGNGLLKDPLCLYALGLLCYNLFVKQKYLFTRIFKIVAGAFLLLYIKSYILYGFCIALSLSIIYLFFKKFSFIGKLFLLALVGIIFTSSYGYIANTLNESIEETIKYSQKSVEVYLETASEQGGSLVMATIDPSPFGLIKFSFNGLITVFMKPFPWELNKIIYLFLILENLGIYYLIFLKIKDTGISPTKNKMFFMNFCVFFFIVMGIIVGITTFNLGTIARYRVQALPFLFGGLFSLKIINKKMKSAAHSIN
jgi:hypothetical protein